MEPRARVSVWPGRRRVPGIVAPDSWGARGAECLPRDVLRHTLPAAASLCNGPTACHGLCHRHGSGTTEARPPASSVPPAPHGGLGVLSRHLVNSGPDFRSSSSGKSGVGSSFFPENDEPTPGEISVPERLSLGWLGREQSDNVDAPEEVRPRRDLTRWSKAYEASNMGASKERRKSGVSSGGNPVSVHHSFPRKSGVQEIRCPGNPVSVHHSCPKR